MTRWSVPALWRAAPRRLLGTPGWFVLVTVAAGLVVASFVAPAVFTASARAAALDAGLRATVGERIGDTGDLRVSWDAVLPDGGEQLLLDEVGQVPGYGPPELGGVAVGQDWRTQARAVAGGAHVPAVLWFHDGAVAALGGDEDAPGIWLAEDAAASLGLVPGDPVRVGLQSVADSARGTLAATVLAGTFPTTGAGVLPTAVEDLPGVEEWVLPDDPQSPGRDNPLAVVSQAEFTRLVAAVDETPLYTADLALEPDPTPEEAAATVAAVAALGERAFDDRSALSGALLEGLPVSGSLLLGTALPDIVLEARASASSASVQVRPYAAAGQVLAVGLLMALWVLLSRVRRREQLLVSDLGLRPGEVGGLAALEVGLATVLAVPVGLGLAVLGVTLTGPTTSVSLTGADVLRGVLAAAGGLLLVTAAATVAAVLTDRRSWTSRLGRGRGGRSLPWRTLVLVATGAAAAGVLVLEAGERSQSPVAALLPALVAISASLLVVPAVAWLVARAPLLGRPGGPRWLARRRRSTVGRDVAALTAVLGVALGLFGYCLAVRTGVEEGVSDKSAALAGARSVAQVDDAFRGGGVARATTPPLPGSTLVWRLDVTLPPAFGDQALMAVDTSSFAEVADWGASGVLDEGRDLLDLLDERGERLPVLLAGRTDLEVGHRGVLGLSGEGSIPYEVVGVVPAFPGSANEPTDVTLVVSTTLVMAQVPPTIDPLRVGASSEDAGTFRSTVWSHGAAARLSEELAADGVPVREVETRGGLQVRNGLVASTWAADYLLSLAAVLLVVAASAALVLALRLRERDAVSDVVLRRMGFGSRELARGRWWEAVGTLTTALVAGALAVLVLLAAPTLIDQTAAIAPLARPRVGWWLVLVLGATLAVLLLGVGLVGGRRTRRRAAEVLREYA